MKWFIFVALLASCAAFEDDIRTCDSAVNCRVSEVCYENVCVEDEPGTFRRFRAKNMRHLNDGTPKMTKIESCSDRHDCDFGETCHRGKCVEEDLEEGLDRKAYNRRVLSGQEIKRRILKNRCFDGPDCEFGEVCKEGVCVQDQIDRFINDAPKSARKESCFDRHDCDFGDKCDRGKCVVDDLGMGLDRKPFSSRRSSQTIQPRRAEKVVSHEICKTHLDCPMNHACNFVKGGTGLKRCLWQDPGQRFSFY